ncbi:4-hydroxy-tetrahydrodipicolinate synthase family protein [Antrihabitans stalactiti]|uniref:4-hydroxy-tetrahydrodipicolinate synthase n=1 Tax=Antrihabitans stalactiti TaxID=2584121 RepID=A0A848K5D8_9NOCA|nr:4-hydroxy-tetrahydrodipicolinate synthase [Antrihabitans stalactiti]NMN93609.1 4-hydroxy-tetrahydrodipicolinate synthase [Antrihabitans stalactiti]
MSALHGIFVPLITPFATDGSVAFDALEQLARDVLADGATGIVALGTTAESAALDNDERRAVVDVCTRVCREHRSTLIVGAGANDTRGSAAALAALGPEVSAAMVPVPYFTRPTPAGVVAHFSALAAVSPVPLIVYHVPYRTGLDLDADCLRALGGLPGVVGVKYSAGGIDGDAIDLLSDPPRDFAVLAGDDAFVSPFLALGASGGILASAVLATRQFVELADAWSAGDVARARELGHRLTPLSAAAFAEPNPTVIKGVLHAQGRIPTPDVRLPLLPARQASVDAALMLLPRLAGAVQ